MPTTTTTTKLAFLDFFVGQLFLSDLFLGFIWNDVWLVFFGWPPLLVRLDESPDIFDGSRDFGWAWDKAQRAFPLPKKHGYFFPMGKIHPNFWGWGKHTHFFFEEWFCFFCIGVLVFRGVMNMVVIREISFISSDLSGKRSIHWLLLSGTCPWVSCWMGIVSLDVGYCGVYFDEFHFVIGRWIFNCPSAYVNCKWSSGW